MVTDIYPCNQVSRNALSINVMLRIEQRKLLVIMKKYRLFRKIKKILARDSERYCLTCNHRYL